MTSGSAQEAGLKLPPLSFLRAPTSKEAADNVFSLVQALQQGAAATAVSDQGGFREVPESLMWMIWHF